MPHEQSMIFKVSATGPQAARHLLRALVEINLDQIREAGTAAQFPVLIGLQNGSIVYVRRDDDEWWKDWTSVLSTSAGDCEDLVCAVVAEMLANGIQARPYAYLATPTLWHVVVQYIDAKTGEELIVDPSRLGGMGKVT